MHHYSKILRLFYCFLQRISAKKLEQTESSTSNSRQTTAQLNCTSTELPPRSLPITPLLRQTNASSSTPALSIPKLAVAPSFLAADVP